MPDTTKSTVYGRKVQGNGSWKDRRFGNGLGNGGTVDFSGVAESVCVPESNDN